MLSTPQLPGLYPGPSQSSILRANEQQYLFQNSTVIAGQASIAVEIERIAKAYGNPFGMSFSFWFTATPGAFQFDVQTSDLDTDSQYVTINSLNGGLNASFVGRIELPSFYAKYTRVKCVTLTNVVGVTALVTR